MLKLSLIHPYKTDLSVAQLLATGGIMCISGVRILDFSLLHT